MREMVYRERNEKVALLESVVTITCNILGIDPNKFSGVALAKYAMEVFQEDYNAEFLQARLEQIKNSQLRIKKEQDRQAELMARIERMGEFYDKQNKPGKAKK